MYRVIKDKLRNVKDELGNIKTYCAGESLPESFIPDLSWIKNGIIEEIKTFKSKKSEVI